MEYKADQEYKMKYIDKDQKEHEATYTPDKDTNIAGMINGFKDKTKDFFKLLSIDNKSLDESRKITEEKDFGLKDALDNDVELFDDIYLYLDEYIEDEDTKSEIEDIIDKYTGIGGSAEDLDEDSEEYKSELEDCINEIEDLLNLNESKKITEEKINDFFFNQGLEKAKEITKREGCLTCCDIVSKEVSELAKQYHINCKPVNLKVFTKNDSGTFHSAILYNNYGKLVIIDYTQKQFFGSDSPEDTKCDVIEMISSNYSNSSNGTYFDGGLFSNNKFYYDGKEIKAINLYNDDSHNFIRDFNDGIIKTDNDAIIYLYGSMKITESKKITEADKVEVDKDGNKSIRDEKTGHLKRIQVSKKTQDKMADKYNKKQELNEAGEWDDSDPDMQVWEESMREAAEEIARNVGGECKSVHGFDVYQGPFAVVSTPKHGDVIVWFGQEKGLFDVQVAHVGWIEGSIEGVSLWLNKDKIPQEFIIKESEKFKGKELNESKKSGYIIFIKDDPNGYSYQGHGGRSRVRLDMTDALDVYDTVEQAQKEVNTYKNPKKIKIMKFDGKNTTELKENNNKMSYGDDLEESKKITESEDKPELADMLIEINRYYIDYIDNISFFIDLAKVAGIDYDKVYDWYKSIKEDENDDLEESKKITESRDRVAETLPKFIYDLDKDGAWSAREPSKTLGGKIFYKIDRNGLSSLSNDELIKAVLDKFPELKLYDGFRNDGDIITFVKKITESEDKYTYDKDEEEKLRKIFKDLQDGYSYGYDMKNVSHPIFKKVLSIGKSFGQKDYGTNYINVNYYGGTSHKITLDNLKWIMDKIFNMTPSKFLSKFIRNDKSTIKD